MANQEKIPIGPDTRKLICDIAVRILPDANYDLTESVASATRYVLGLVTTMATDGLVISDDPGNAASLHHGVEGWYLLKDREEDD